MMRGGSILGMSWSWMIVGASGSWIGSRYAFTEFEKISLTNGRHLEHQKFASAVGAFKNTDGTVVTVFTNIASTPQSVALSFSGFTSSTAAGYLPDNTHQVVSTSVTCSGG